MAIAFPAGGAGTFGVSTGSSVTPALPASVVQDDLLIAHVSGRTTAAMTPPAGWTQLDLQQNSETPDTRLFILWKFAGASESAPTVTITGSGVACAISRWTGVPVRANPWLIAAVKQQGSGLTMAGLTMTPGVDQAMAIWFWTQDNNGATSTVTNSATVAYGGSPAYNTTTIPSGTNVSAAYKIIAGTGATGATNMTSASGTQNCFIGCALDPTPSGGPRPLRVRSQAVTRSYSY